MSEIIVHCERFLWQMCAHTSWDKQGQHGRSDCRNLFSCAGCQEERAYYRLDSKFIFILCMLSLQPFDCTI